MKPYLPRIKEACEEPDPETMYDRLAAVFLELGSKTGMPEEAGEDLTDEIEPFSSRTSSLMDSADAELDLEVRSDSDGLKRLCTIRSGVEYLVQTLDLEVLDDIAESVRHLDEVFEVLDDARTTAQPYPESHWWWKKTS